MELVRGVDDHAVEIDELIGRLARGWTLERMPALDLEVLRVACFELAHRPDVPTGVVLSEAVDLAGRYGTDDSSRFVNGVLSPRRGGAPPRPDAPPGLSSARHLELSYARRPVERVVEGGGLVVPCPPDREGSPVRLLRTGRTCRVAERERRLTRPYGGVFIARSRVMDAEDIHRALRRMAHEILERNHGLDELVLVGLQTGGVALAHALAATLAEIEELGPDDPAIPVGTLDVALYRDDIGIRPVLPEEVTEIPVDLDAMTVVLVDDVLFTGRTIRAALDAMGDYGRPRAVQLAVMVDRGHRELPIRPDYVGKNLPTRRDELVDVTMSGVELGELQKP